MADINQLAQTVYSTAVELRTVCERFSSKRVGGEDPKTLFSLTDQEVVDGLKATVKPAIIAHKTALTALVTEIKASVDSTVS